MITKFNKYKFIKENSEFNQYQFGISPSSALGGATGEYGFAVDAGVSVFASQDSPYTNQYYATANQINNVLSIMKNVYQNSNRPDVKLDYFLDDIDGYTDLKILRIHRNENLTLDIFISFLLGEDEFFGVYRNFNSIQRQKLISDLFTDSQFNYIDNQYRLKLDTYFYKILNNWFQPKKGDYRALKDVICRNQMGENTKIKENSQISVYSVNKDKDGNSFVRIKVNDDIFLINKNDYYFFNYWFEKINNNKIK